MFFSVIGENFHTMLDWSDKYKIYFQSFKNKTSPHTFLSQGSTLFSCWCPKVMKNKHEAEFHSEISEVKGLFLTALQSYDGRSTIAMTKILLVKLRLLPYG